MEVLHTNKSVGSGFHSQEHGNPAGFLNMDSTRFFLKAISKANLQEDARVHLLAKFFEELGSFSMEAVQRETKNRLCARDTQNANSELLQAALLCAQALSSARVADKVRFHFLCKVLDLLSGDNMERKFHCSLEIDQADNVKDFIMGSSTHKEKNQASSHEGSDHEGQQKILSFLNKAVAHGALVLTDCDSVLRCVRESCMDSSREKENTHNNEGQVQAPANSMEHEQVNMDGKEEHSQCSKGTEGTLCSMGNQAQVITQISVPQVTSVPTPSPLSFVTGRGESQHGLHSMAGEKDKESHTQLQIRTPNSCPNLLSTKGDCSLLGISEKVVRREDIHVINSLPPLSSLQAGKNKLNPSNFSGFTDTNQRKDSTHVPNSLTFLEAAKLNLKSSSDFVSLQSKEAECKHLQTSSFSTNGFPIFKIDHTILHKKMEMCRFSVLGKISLAKGDEPWTWVKLKQKLDVLWGLKSQWRLISLGKGFFHIILSNQEEHDKVWSKEVLHLNPGVLRIQRWTFGFDPSSEKTTKAQVWFRIHHLPWCLWDASTISGIARKIGEPLRIDKTTLEGSFGHYARVLIEVDMLKPVLSSILVDYSSQIIEVQILPENIPLFCRGCNSIGHIAKDCRMLLKMDNNNSSYAQESSKTYIGASFINVKDSKRSVQQSEWRKKKVHVIGKESAQKAETSGEKQETLKTTTEMITDFGAQREVLSSEDKCPNFLSDNQFYLLSDLDGIDNEEKIDGNVLNEDFPSSTKIVEDTGTMDTLAATRQNNIIEDATMDNSMNDVIDTAFLPSKMPEKWGDLLDEEQEMDRDSRPRPIRDISEIREGLKTIFIELPTREMDLIETDRSLFQDDPILPITPLHIHKDKKVKIGFRPSKRSSGSSMR